MTTPITQATEAAIESAKRVVENAPYEIPSETEWGKRIYDALRACDCVVAHAPLLRSLAGPREDAGILSGPATSLKGPFTIQESHQASRRGIRGIYDATGHELYIEEVAAALNRPDAPCAPVKINVPFALPLEINDLSQTEWATVEIYENAASGTDIKYREDVTEKLVEWVNSLAAPCAPVDAAGLFEGGKAIAYGLINLPNGITTSMFYRRPFGTDHPWLPVSNTDLESRLMRGKHDEVYCDKSGAPIPVPMPPANSTESEK